LKKDLKIDYEIVRRMAAIHCTIREIASVVGVHYSTLNTRPEFQKIFGEEYNKAKERLRKLQWDAAEKGNTTMLIWLGKQYLGQKEPVKDMTLESKSLDLKELAQFMAVNYDKRKKTT